MICKGFVPSGQKPEEFRRISTPEAAPSLLLRRNSVRFQRFTHG
jgi:hypothetical protein